MESITVNQFRDNLRYYVEAVAEKHEVLTVSRRSGKAFVVMSQEDWESMEETLHVLQNASLMTQIQKSMETHKKNQGYHPTQEELDRDALHTREEKGA